MKYIFIQSYTTHPASRLNAYIFLNQWLALILEKSSCSQRKHQNNNIYFAAISEFNSNCAVLINYHKI